MDTFRVKAFKGQRALENLEKGKSGKHNTQITVFEGR